MNAESITAGQLPEQPQSEEKNELINIPEQLPANQPDQETAVEREKNLIKQEKQANNREVARAILGIPGYSISTRMAYWNVLKINIINMELLCDTPEEREQLIEDIDQWIDPSTRAVRYPGHSEDEDSELSIVLLKADKYYLRLILENQMDYASAQDSASQWFSELMDRDEDDLESYLGGINHGDELTLAPEEMISQLSDIGELNANNDLAHSTSGTSSTNSTLAKASQPTGLLKGMTGLAKATRSVGLVNSVKPK